MQESILTASAISLAYKNGDSTTYALNEVTVQLPDREFIGIMGPSGSGKSSLLYILSGLKRPTSGETRFRNTPYGNQSDAQLTDLRRQKFGFVFQQPWLLPWQTTLENVMMGAPLVNKESVAQAEGRFQQLGIGALSGKFPSQLSGGEKQRVCVARAMMNSPAVIFADEPTASLDHTNGRLVVDLLSAYKDHGTVIIVTHDAEMLGSADRVLVMRDGKTVDWVSPKEAAAGRSFAVNIP